MDHVSFVDGEAALLLGLPKEFFGGSHGKDCEGPAVLQQDPEDFDLRRITASFLVVIGNHYRKGKHSLGFGAPAEVKPAAYRYR